MVSHFLLRVGKSPQKGQTGGSSSSGKGSKGV